MLERSPLAENALQCLHDEDYGRPYDTRNLDNSTMIFVGGRNATSLNGDWNFCVDLLDTGSAPEMVRHGAHGGGGAHRALGL